MPAHASPEFEAEARGVLAELASSHPDARVREAATVDVVQLLAAPDEWDIAAATGGVPWRGGSLLLGLHIGMPGDGRSHYIRVYEAGVRQAAQMRSIPLGDQIEVTLLHEFEHHYGWCPDGHGDCTPEERLATPAAQVLGPT